MKQKRGTPLFDGSSCVGTHYVALIDLCCATTGVGTIITPRLSTIGVYPMGTQGAGEDGSDVSEESARFYAEPHVDIFRDMFEIMKMYFDD